MYTFTFNGSTYAIGPYTLTVVGSIYAISLVVVLVLPKYNRDAARNALQALIRIDVWLAAAFVVFVMWGILNDFAPVGWGVHALDEWRLSAESEGANVFRGLITVLYLILVLPVGAILTVVAAGYVIVFVGFQIHAFITLLVLPVHAARTLFGVVAHAVRGILFFLTKPAAVREVKRTIKHQHKHPDAGAHIKKVIDSEARRAVSRQHRWWRPTFKISSATRHYNKLANYLHSLAEVSDAAEKHVTKEERKKYD
jgi:hypothetical protein